jgi:dolichol kinase
MREEIIRKLFHLLALVYVAGALFLPRPVFLSGLAFLLVCDFIFETVRIRVPRFRPLIDKLVGGLVRAEESQKFTAVFWMLLGVFSAALVIGPPKLLVTIYLFLIFGDGVASLVGKGFGGPHWPNSPKRISGSLACFAVCLVSGILLLRPEYSWPGILLGALAATILEFGIVPVNDNLTIPLGSSLVFLLIYRVPLGI